MEVNDGLGLLKLADTSLILINPSPSNVKNKNKQFHLGTKEFLPATASSEDCLYLNVFVPDIKVRVQKGARRTSDKILKNGLPVLGAFHVNQGMKTKEYQKWSENLGFGLGKGQ